MTNCFNSKNRFNEYSLLVNYNMVQFKRIQKEGIAMNNLKWQLKQLELTTDYLLICGNLKALWANMREIEKVRKQIWWEENRNGV